MTSQTPLEWREFARVIDRIETFWIDEHEDEYDPNACQGSHWFAVHITRELIETITETCVYWQIEHPHTFLSDLAERLAARIPWHRGCQCGHVEDEHFGEREECGECMCTAFQPAKPPIDHTEKSP